MGFSDKQLRALQRGVPARNVRTRKLNGREFPYIEGWMAIAEANRIFGFDGWDRETVESRCVVGREVRGSFFAIYTAKVRITVRTAGSTVVREGNGSGEARSTSAGEVHEIALKAAETDATKRALATFGKPFGLALYLGRRPAIQPHANGHHDRRLNGSGPEAPQDTPRVPSDAFPQPAIETATNQADPQNPAGPQKNDIQTAPVSVMEPAALNPDAARGEPISASVPVRIDKSMLAFGEPRRERDKHHLLFVATQPCLICSRAPSDAHHLRFAQTRALGRKVGDQFTVPLCREHHRQLHECSDEASWWTDLEVDALEIAKGLWEQSRAKRAALVRSIADQTAPVSAAAKR